LTYCAFDIDGTIYDCGPIILEAFQEGARRYAADSGAPLRVPTREDILRVVGLPTDEMFYRLYPALSTAENDRLNFISTECLSAMVRGRGGILFDGVRETLEELDGRGVRMLVASNGKPRYIEAILETYDLVRFFSGRSSW
jgi:phosphoglycolate phosphatase-like HAD superfamily hydrolase